VLSGFAGVGKQVNGKGFVNIQGDKWAVFSL
jgi:hypothetical protein